MGGDSGTRIQEFLTSSFIEVKISSYRLHIIELLLRQQIGEIRDVRYDNTSISWIIA